MLLIIGLIGLADYYIGKRISFSIFYLIPIFFLLWVREEKWPGFIISIVATLVWYIADSKNNYNNVHFMIPYWNALTRFIVFMVFVLILSKLKRTLEQEKLRARTDYITGINNSQAFFEMAGKELLRCNRYNHPVSIAYIDCDDFKKVNDTQGHKTGNRLLKLIAQFLKDNTRSIDIIARIGGDEFVVLFPETDKDNSFKVVERVQQKIFNLMKENNWSVTLSIGLLTIYECDINIEELIHQADNLMYQAKKKGKNNIQYKIIK